ncbi:MAG: tetratricopeptide repeat protein, partial [Desulfobacteraceae bacterium]|nr:tetratricopeptide repeat protein [Desulfobacteraceae bacterium]
MKILPLTCFFLLSCASCAATSPLPAQQPLPAPAVGKETADSVCAYSHFLEGKSAEAAGRLEEARAAYEKAMACASDPDYLMRTMAVLLARMERKKEAAAWLEKIRKRHPADSETLTFVADLYADMGMTSQAGELYRQILAREPENFEVALQLGILYARNRQFPQAREMLERLVRIDPGSQVGHYYLGKLYQELNEPDKAVASYGKALAIEWSDDLAFETADLYERLNRPEKAIALYRKILAEDPANERARGALAGVYLQQGELDRALAELKELRNYTSDLRKVDFTIGRLLIEQERYDEAIAQFSRLLAEDPGFDAARYLLALIHYEKKNSKKAAELLRQIPAGAETYEDATLLLGKILEDQNDPAAVEKLYAGRLAGKSTRRPVFYVALASFYQEHGQPEKGQAVYAEALSRYPDNPRVLFEHALFLDRLARQDEAIAEMQKVLAIEPHNPYALNYVGYTWADRGVNLKEAL